MTRLRSLAFLVLLLLSSQAKAQPADILARRAGEIVAVMQGVRPPAETFSDHFLADVSPAELAALSRRIQADSGKLLAAENVRATGSHTADFRLRFERATAAGHLTLEAQAPFKVSGFLITSVIPDKDSLERIVADFAALPGKAGFAVVELGETPRTLFAHDDEAQYAIGSAFKLWVLDALAQDIAEGRHRWDEVVRIGPRSLPSGIAQNWPPDAAATVETLATLMISISDNTATDTLVRLIGRDRIGARIRAMGHSDPARTLPLLTTAEAFALKLSPTATQQAYARADEAGRTAMLASLDAPKVLASTDRRVLQQGPVAVDEVEWFASPQDLLRVLDTLRRHRDPRVLQILAIHPAMAPELRQGFSYVGYKGGSEPGVIDLTWLVQRRSGDWLAISAAWNDRDKAVDNAKLEALAQRIIRLTAAAD